MDIIPLDDPQSWNKFCLDHAWFWHTTWWMEYQRNSKFGAIFTDRSFLLRQNGHIIDIVSLIQEDDQLISPGFSDRKEILAEVKRIALENGIKRIKVNCDIREYLSIPSYTCILDLDDIQPTKGHRSAIKKAEKYLIWTDQVDIETFRDDYYRIAGKITRPAVTFNILGEWIRQGFGILLEAQYENATAGYVYLLHWKDRAYYFMSCVEPEFKQYNVSHYLQSVAFDILRRRGIKRYELGEQVYNSLHCQPMEKERNISLFKRGFGGQIVRSPASEYFFDAEYGQEVMKQRIENYFRGEHEANLLHA
jgi:hypothetical protein